jgi:glycosyltransferase involved in cell wall biosynthesis
LISEFGIEKGRISVVYNGVDHGKYQPSREKYESATITYLGRLMRYKRVDHIVRAFSIVLRRFPQARLIVIGSGETEEELKELAKRMHMMDRVIFKGRVSEEEKIETIRRSWVLVSTSMKEGFGISLLEGASCGVPAVAYDAPGLSEVVADGVTGLLVPEGDIDRLGGALAEVLTDDENRANLGKNAHLYSKGFDWDDSAKRFRGVIEERINREPLRTDL